jgi:hypothetical protein
VIVSCSAGTEELFASELGGWAPRSSRHPSRAARPRRRASLRGRASEGGRRGLRAERRRAGRPRPRAMLARHRETGAAATIAVAPLKSPFGVVDLGERRRRHRIPRGARAAELGQLRHLRPRRGGRRAAAPSAATTRTRPFRSSLARGASTRFETRAFWLTVNTPKDLRQAEEAMSSEAALTLVGRLG